ncbi:DNA-3-methyladenine glycosylase [bacterium]|nr:DNA-3-methyladenine glycosylase [bacterium]
MRIDRKFYLQPTLIIARKLLGKYLVRRISGKKKIAKIVETEAYIGPEDKASHAYGGRITQRTSPLYLKGGFTYIYLCYGIHWLFNIVTREEGIPECVLIRAVEPLVKGKQDSSELKNLTNGPAKLCRWLNIDKNLNAEDLVTSRIFWIEDRKEIIRNDLIVASPRIGVDYAKEWADKPWRFYLKDNIFVSRR